MYPEGTLLRLGRVVARRVQRETGISQGHASVSSVAVDYVRQVFSHFDDKTVLVIGAEKIWAGTVTIDASSIGVAGTWPLPPGGYTAYYLLDGGYTSAASVELMVK